MINRMKEIINTKSLKLRFFLISLFNLILSLLFARIIFEVFDIYHSYHDLLNSRFLILLILLVIIHNILLNIITIRIIFLPILSLSKQLRLFLHDYNPNKLDLDKYPELSNIVSPLLDLINSIKSERDMALVIKKKSDVVIKTKERDVLTNLYNREFLQRHLPYEISRARILSKSVSLVMLDVDDFKHYNDTNGHPKGDKALKMVADLVQSKIRNYDICIRYGGEEFCIIMPGAIPSNAMVICERIRKVVEGEYFEFEEKQPNGNLTVSLGIASFPDHASNENDLLKYADMALYEAKRSGKNKVCIYNPPQ